MKFYTREDIENLDKSKLFVIIRGLQKRLSIATDFTQCEMDERNTCEICKIPYHEDYCYTRDEGEYSLKGFNICDICYEEDI